MLRAGRQGWSRRDTTRGRVSGTEDDSVRGTYADRTRTERVQYAAGAGDVRGAAGNLAEEQWVGNVSNTRRKRAVNEAGVRDERRQDSAGSVSGALGGKQIYYL